MTWAPTPTLDDHEDESERPDRTLEDLAEELTGEPSVAVSDQDEDDARLSEEELDAAAGFQSPPGRID